IFMSGLAKLLSGDLTWRSLTALAYHYETQPLPNPFAWYMHKLPAGFQKFSTLFSLVIELAPPWLFLFPGLLGWIGGILSILLQFIILLTGNFAFFNYLTIVLSIFLYNDAVFQRLLPSSLLRMAGAGLPAGAPYAWGDIFPVLLAVFIFITGLLTMLVRFSRDVNLIKTFQPFLRLTGSLRLVNSYGLFASMTTVRPEIILEGSDDSQTWKPYRFKYKPGDLQRRPPLVAPHQPRLDWQMWFAALADYQASPWILNLAESLLSGSPEVLKLLSENPFPEKPPRFLRGMLYDYHFTTFEERKLSGNWWKREALGPYLPVVSLK
ncbi:MAG: lipase maturation factor family protein, partial [Omnitrophica WOR_2 bacterium]